MQYSDLLALLPWSVGVYITYAILRALYNITLHPLAKYPGPKLYGAFFFPRYWVIYTGDHVSTIHALHKKYGPVVRTAPDALLFNTSQALRDIYATPPKGKKQVPKDQEFYGDSFDSVHSILEADDVTHARQRRILSHAFSEQALRDQEGLIHRYTDLLISRLHEQVNGPSKGKIDLVRWLNFTTFDIIGDLAFAEPFQALEKGEYHFWMAAIFGNMKFGVIFRIIRAYPLLDAILKIIIINLPFAAETMKKLRNDTKDKTMRRVQSKTDRKDFMSHFIHKGDEVITEGELIANAGLFIVAGSETSATLLSGLFFYLLKNPEYLSKLRDEVRSAFDHAHEMTFQREAKLPYLHACIEEALRIYPPVPTDLPRRTSPEGTIINGELIPGKTAVSVSHYCTFHSADNFKDPDAFHPERWLGDPEYENDNLAAVQPFSLGARNCIGKNLAHAEMRSIVCRLLWNFDLELCPESNNWNQQKVYFLWEKPPLMVKLTARI